MDKYRIVYKRSLAEALNFMGLQYYIYNSGDKNIYSFENNEKFHYILHKVLNLRNEIQEELEKK